MIEWKLSSMHPITLRFWPRVQTQKSAKMKKTRWQMAAVLAGGAAHRKKIKNVRNGNLVWYMSYGISHQMAIEPLTWGEHFAIACHVRKRIIFHDIPWYSIGIGGYPNCQINPGVETLQMLNLDPAASRLRCKHICRKATNASDQTRCRTMYIMHPPLYNIYIHTYIYNIFYIDAFPNFNLNLEGKFHYNVRIQDMNIRWQQGNHYKQLQKPAKPITLWSDTLYAQYAYR